MIKPLLFGFAILVLTTIISLVFHDWNILLKYSGGVGLLAFVLAAILSGSWVSAEQRRLDSVYESKEEKEVKWKWSNKLFMFSLPNFIGELIVLFLLYKH